MSSGARELVVFLVAVLVLLIAGMARWVGVEIGAGSVAVVAALGVCDIL